MKKICILDYGLGNIRSLFNAIKKIGFNPTFFSERKNNNFDIVFVPGVGSFLAASKLVSSPDIQLFLNDVKSNQNIMGVDLPFDEPSNPNIILDSYKNDPTELLKILFEKHLKSLF